MVSLISNDIFGIKPRGDRAVILENAWERRYAHYTGQDPASTTLAQPLTKVRQDLLAKTETAWLPMLVLGGTSVTTGRRILTTDIDTLLSAKLNSLRGRLFRDAYDLHELLAPRSVIRTASFSPDGAKFLISYDTDTKPEIWDTKTGTIVRQLDLGQPLEGTVWSSDGAHILSWLYEDSRALRITSVATGQVVRIIPDVGMSPVLSPQGDRILTESGEKLLVWDVATGGKLLEIQHGQSVGGSANFSRDGRSILHVRRDFALVVYNASTGQVERTIPDFGYQGTVGLSADRRFVFSTKSTEAGRAVRVLELGTGKQVFSLGYEQRIAAFSPDGDRLIYASIGGAIRVRDFATGTDVEVPNSADETWTEPVFSRNGRRIMLWSGGGGATVLDAATGAELRVIRGQEGRVYEAHFTPDATLALTLSDNGLGRLWRLETGEELYVIRGTQAGKGCTHCDVALSTASTMSARFPIISPHGNIRNGSSLVDRVVDGGYYENFGALSTRARRRVAQQPIQSGSPHHPH